MKKTFECWTVVAAISMLTAIASSAVQFPPKVCFTAVHPGAGYGLASYFDVTVFLPGGSSVLFDGWCVDTDRGISTTHPYTAEVLTLDDPAVLGLVAFPVNLDLALYVVNRHYQGLLSQSGGSFTYGDVQRAIWQLLESNQSDSGLGDWSQLRVDEIVRDAQQHGEGFTPACGQDTVLFLVPVFDGCDPNTTQTGIIKQIVIIQIPVECASIGDFIWYDTNNNGIQDAGEVGVAGVTVNLLDCANQLLATTTTDASGKYLFSNLKPGSYKIQVAAPAGYTFSPQNQGADDQADSDADAAGFMDCTTLTAGENDLSWDAGLVEQRASIGDFVWFDANRNGIQDAGEVGVAGVTVRLLDCQGNVQVTTTTDPNGYYSFTGLLPGNYAVQFVAPAGYAFSPQDQGSDDLVDSDADITSGQTACTTLSPGESDLSWDAGLYMLPASLGDFVWYDANANGIQDANELGVAGVTVRLLNCQGTVLASTTTDASGNYLFGGLQPADYSVEFVLPGGYVFSPQDQGSDDTADSDANPATGRTVCTTLLPGENDLTWDAGVFMRTASIGDFVWHDLNNNGIQDANEPGVAGVIVRLLDCQGTVLASTTTDANGLYSFSGLMPGSYNIQVVAPAGSVFAKQDQGGDDALDSDVDAAGNMPCTTLDPGENDTSWDAGLVALASIGDFVWFDANKNGIQDAGEPGVAGVTVRLLDCQGNVLASTTTGANGYYNFTGLLPGNYAVEFVLPSGYAFSPKDQGGDDTRDSDADPLTGRTVCTTLNAGENDTTWDAGVYQKPTGPGTGTPGYWKNHPEAWPVASIVVGGRTYTKAQAIAIMKTSVSSDKRYTMFPALVCAKLNVLIGNDSSCIAGVIAQADAWWATYRLNLVSGSSAAWKIGEPLYQRLDAYNNGLLCAPHRD